MSARAACIGWRSSELPGLPASRDFPDGRRWPRTRFLGFVRGAQICMVSGERDMTAASTGWLSRSVLDVVSRRLPLRAVQCQAYTLQQGHPAHAFCHHTRWATAGNCSLVGLDWHILRKLLWEIFLHLATSEFEPQTLTTHHLYCKSLQYKYSIIIYTMYRL